MTTSFNASAQTATLKVPSSLPNSGPKLIPCLFEGLTGQVLTLACSEKPAVSAAVSVEYNDAMFLGEVVTIGRHASGHWEAQIAVEQVLTGLQSLLTLRNRLLGEGVGASVSRSEAAHSVKTEAHGKPREFCLGY